MSTTITLRDQDREVVLLGSRPAGSDGVWEFTDLGGWRGHAPSKRNVRERPQAHGAFRSRRVLRAGRSLAFTARFISSDRAAFLAALDEFAAIGAESPATMTVADESGTTSREVVIVTGEETMRRARINTGFEVELRADDPKRYAVDADTPWQVTGPMSAGAGLLWPAVWPLKWPGGGSSGRVALVNTGSAPAAPVFRLRGGFESALITCSETGARIGLDRPVPEGSFVEIDAATSGAMLDGIVSVSRWIQHREWEYVPAHGERTFQFDVNGATGEPVMEGRVLSAWW